jgi:hypothetical protein
MKMIKLFANVGSQNRSGFWIHSYRDFRKCESRLGMCYTYHLGQECRLSVTGQLLATRSRSTRWVESCKVSTSR